MFLGGYRVKVILHNAVLFIDIRKGQFLEINSSSIHLVVCSFQELHLIITLSIIISWV